MRRDEISVERVPRARGLDQNNGISNCKLNTGYGKSNKMKTSGALQSIGEQRRKTESASSSKKKKGGKEIAGQQGNSRMTLRLPFVQMRKPRSFRGLFTAVRSEL